MWERQRTASPSSHARAITAADQMRTARSAPDPRRNAPCRDWAGRRPGEDSRPALLPARIRRPPPSGRRTLQPRGWRITMSPSRPRLRTDGKYGSWEALTVHHLQRMQRQAEAVKARSPSVGRRHGRRRHDRARARRTEPDGAQPVARAEFEGPRGIVRRGPDLPCRGTGNGLDDPAKASCVEELLVMPLAFRVGPR